MRALKILSVFLTVASFALFVLAVYLRMRSADTHPPEIRMEQTEIRLSVQAGEEEILQGVIAQDAEDGNVTDSLLVESLSPFVADAERIATIVAFDGENHVTKTTRTIHYTDYTKPRFTLAAPLSFAAGSSSSALTTALSAWDCLDGDVTRRITRATVDGNGLSTELAGEYPVTFSVSNSAGDVERFTATVEIYDPLVAELAGVTLTEAMIYLPKGAAFDPRAYVARVDVGGTVYLPFHGELVSASLADRLQKFEEGKTDEMPEIGQEMRLSWEEIQIDNPVDPQTPGWYEVSYRTNLLVGKSRCARLLVRVED